MDIWTIQLSNWRLAKQHNIPILDITAKTGSKLFCPDFNVVMQYKRGLITQDTYTELYLDRMRSSLRHNPTEWEMLFNYEKVALACYCAAGKFCHRLLFADIMKSYLEDYDISVVLRGELLKGRI